MLLMMKTIKIAIYKSSTDSEVEMLPKKKRARKEVGGKKKKQCEHPGCTKRPSYNHPGETTGRCCSQHKKIGMVDVESKRCEHPGCTKQGGRHGEC